MSQFYYINSMKLRFLQWNIRYNSDFLKIAELLTATERTSVNDITHLIIVVVEILIITLEMSFKTG